MKKITFTLSLLFTLSILSYGQYVEGGFFLGTSIYSGDLNESSFATDDANLGYGLLLRINANDYISVGIKVTQGTLEGSDHDAENESLRLRNLSFRSPITELSITPEFNILGYNPYDRLISPYVFIGPAFYKFRPEALYENDWIQLQPLGTEGQGMDGFPRRYELNRIALNMGGGVKISVNEYWNVGLEVGFRKTFFDHIDDVSGDYVTRPDLLAGNGELSANLANRTGEISGGEPVIVPTGTPRGNADDDDWYYFLGVTLTYNFLDGFGGGKKYGCPTNF